MKLKSVQFDDDETKRQGDVLNRLVRENDNVFIFIHLRNCLPCIETRKEWDKLLNTDFDASIAKTKTILINADSSFVRHIPVLVNKQYDGFPMLFYIGKDKTRAEEFQGRDRSVASFVKWIEDHTRSKSVEQTGGAMTIVQRLKSILKMPGTRSRRKHKKSKRIRFRGIRTRRNKKRRSRILKKDCSD